MVDIIKVVVVNPGGAGNDLDMMALRSALEEGRREEAAELLFRLGFELEVEGVGLKTA